MNGIYVILNEIMKNYSLPGQRAQESKGTLLRVPVSSSAAGLRPEAWHAAHHGTEENKVKVSVTPSAEAIIGNYHMYVETHSKSTDRKKLTSRIEFPDEITLIFNPWCKGKLQ